MGWQTTASVPLQAPAWQVSVRVQASPSSHAVPSASSGVEQSPLAGSHWPAPWHWSTGWQTTASVPLQAPAWQVSVRVQASPSSHAVPSASSGVEQSPLAGSHWPAPWHWSMGWQTTAPLPAQAPAWQLSLRVQASPSSQPPPSLIGSQPSQQASVVRHEQWCSVMTLVWVQLWLPPETTQS